MSIDPNKCCGIHTEEKAQSGECCQIEEQEKAEQDTYEHRVKIGPEPKEINE